MVKILLNHVPTESVQEALEQLLAVKNHGLEHGPRMAPFIALIDAYKHYDNHFHQFDSWHERLEHCNKTISGLQLRLSSFGLQWFCDDEPFEPIPKFDRAPRRSFMLDGKLWNPYAAGSLGVSLYIYKWLCIGAQVGKGGSGPLASLVAALENLCQVSSNQLDQTIASLQERIAATSQPQPKK